MDRLTAQDLMMLWPEEVGWSQDIGAVAILDGRRLLDADGRFRIETAREEIGRRLHLVPRFRQLLYRPRSGWAGRCGSTLRPSTSPSTCECSRLLGRPTSRGCCLRTRSCGTDR
jgi:hypothetical protein